MLCSTTLRHPVALGLALALSIGGCSSLPSAPADSREDLAIPLVAASYYGTVGAAMACLLAVGMVAYVNGEFVARTSDAAVRAMVNRANALLVGQRPDALELEMLDQDSSLAFENALAARALSGGRAEGGQAAMLLAVWRLERAEARQESVSVLQRLRLQAPTAPGSPVYQATVGMQLSPAGVFGGPDVELRVRGGDRSEVRRLARGLCRRFGETRLLLHQDTYIGLGGSCGAVKFKPVEVADPLPYSVAIVDGAYEIPVLVVSADDLASIGSLRVELAQYIAAGRECGMDRWPGGTTVEEFHKALEAYQSRRTLPSTTSQGCSEGWKCS